MKKILKSKPAFILWLALFFSFALISCDKDTEYTYITIIDLENSNVNIGANGGLAKISYTIENPIHGQQIQIDTQADWLSEFNTEIANEISFHVDENVFPEIRRAEVNLFYAGTETSFMVTQQSFESESED